MTDLLEVADLVVQFGPIRAVDGISFSLGEGRALGIVGESGSGKSVTALSLLRLITPPGRIAGGAIRFRGRDLVRIDEPALRALRGAEIAMVFQEPMTSLNPVYTIGDQVGEPLRIHRGTSRREARTRSVELLRRVGIADPERRVDDYPHQLSGGMCQRVMIAMALACRPALLIADEPTTALDVTVQAQILELLGDLRREFGMALLLISHDLAIVAEQCDQVAVMYAGQIVERALAPALFAAPRHPYTAGLMRSLPTVAEGPRQRLREIPGMVPSLASLPPGCHFQDRCDRVAERCRKEAPPLVQIALERQVRCHFPLEPA